MAERRCFSKKVVESDAFRSMPDSAQSLYFHLSMAADDDGFLNCAGSVAVRSATGMDDLEALVQRRFMLRFPGEIYVVKHWRISNSFKNDRIKPLAYPSVAAQIWVEGNRAYTDHPVPDCKTLYEVRTNQTPPDSKNGFQMDSKWIPSGFQMDSQPNLTQPNLTKLNSTQPNQTATSVAGVWEAILQIYPPEKIGNQRTAEEAYRKAIHSEEDSGLMLDNLRVWLRSVQWYKDGGQYIPMLANWISRSYWRTKPTAVLPPPPGYRELDQEELAAIRRELEEDQDDETV